MLVFPLVAGWLGVRAPDKRDQKSQLRHFPQLLQYGTAQNVIVSPTPSTERTVARASKSVITPMAWPTQSVPSWRGRIEMERRSAPQQPQIGGRESCPPIVCASDSSIFLAQCRHGCSRERSGCWCLASAEILGSQREKSSTCVSSKQTRSISLVQPPGPGALPDGELRDAVTNNSLSKLNGTSGLYPRTSGLICRRRSCGRVR